MMIIYNNRCQVLPVGVNYDWVSWALLFGPTFFGSTLIASIMIILVLAKVFIVRTTISFLSFRVFMIIINLFNIDNHSYKYIYDHI